MADCSQKENVDRPQVPQQKKTEVVDLSAHEKETRRKECKKKLIPKIQDEGV